MFALIRKDLIACRLFLVIAIAVYGLYAATAYPRPLIFFLMNIGAAVLLFMMPIVVDDKYRIDTLVCYLPPSRREVVLARYSIGMLAVLTGLALQYGFGAILSFCFEKTDYWAVCTPQTVFVFSIVPLVLFALYLPCYFRFELGRGTFAFAILMVALIFLATSPLLTANFRWGAGFVLNRERLQNPGSLMVAFIDHTAASFGAVWFYATISISAIALMIISLVLSIRVLERRDF